MQDYLIDCTLIASIRVSGKSKPDAIRILKDLIEGSNGNFGCFSNGDPVTGDVSMGSFLEIQKVDD